MTHPRPLFPGDAWPDALLTDRYLDALLGASDRRALDVPADADLDPGIRHAAAVLRASLVRVHPSFRFEDRLGSRLADLAAERTRAELPRGAGVTVLRGDLADRDPLLPAIMLGELDPSDATAVERASGGRVAGRPLLVGGAITSAAISIVGVVYVAWRASRPATAPASRGAMTRAVRLAHGRRAAMAGAGGTGGPA